MTKIERADRSQPPISDLIRYYDMLRAGDADSLIGLFADEPHINTPLEGEVRGESVVGERAN
jgi:hypothetical protein